VNYSLLEKPVFLVGAERSGTTVLRLMLGHHPSIAWCNEFEYSVDPLVDEDLWPDLDSYYEWLKVHRIFQASKFEIDKELNYPSLINSFLCQLRDRTEKPLVGATVHRHFDQLLRIWPDARFIHILRDGRDVARSCIGMGWAGNVWTGVENWIEAEQLWDHFKLSLTPNRYVEVTYESLIAQPQATLTGICEFIGVPYDEAMLSYNENTTYDKPDPHLIAQWKRKLSDWEIQLVESRIDSMLVDRGYELSGLPPIKVTNLMERKLKLQSWYARAMFRYNRFGPKLFLADYLSRKMRLKSWQTNIRLQMNQIETACLK
jgi:hypothetical protein